MGNDSRKMKMSTKMPSWMLILSLILLQFRGAFAIRFMIAKKECLTHEIRFDGDTVHVSFVVIKSDSYWNHYGDDRIDLVIKKPSGEQIHDFHDKTMGKFEFLAQKKGLYQFCFINKSPYKETVDFDVHVSHFLYHDQHVTDEHFNPMLELISKLEEALYSIQFEQHWLEAQTDRQGLVYEVMNQKAVHKAVFESVALVAISFLQVYLLQQLFERKLATSRV